MQALVTRDEALASSPRVKIDTPFVSGSINLKGAQVDDLHLLRYRETIDPKSPTITLLSPAGTPGATLRRAGLRSRHRHVRQAADARDGLDGAAPEPS